MKTLYIDREIDENLARRFLRQLLNKVSNTSITIIINSEGGDITAGLAIFDALLTYKGKTTGIVYGEAQSMASLILQACDKRIVMPNSKLMLHGSSGGIEENSIDKNISQLRWSITEENRLDELYLKAIRQKHSNFTLKALKRKMRNDWYLTAEEAVNWGLADKVGA